MRYKRKPSQQQRPNTQPKKRSEPRIKQTPYYRPPRRKLNLGPMVVIAFGVIVCVFGGIWYTTDAPLVSATATLERQPLQSITVLNRTVTTEAVMAVAQDTITPTPSATPAPAYQETQHAQAMLNLSNQATLEAHLALTKAAFELAVAHQDATATQQAEDQRLKWEHEQATQDAETAAQIAKDRQAKARAEADIALAKLNHTKAINKIAEDDLILRLENERVRDNAISWIAIGIVSCTILALVIVFTIQLGRNMSAAAQPRKTEQPSAIIKPQAADYRTMMSEVDYLRVLRTLKCAAESKFENSTKMPHYSELPGISSEVRSRAANILQELKLATIHDNTASVKGTFYANHMTNKEMYLLFAQGKTKETPLPRTSDRSQMWTGTDDHVPPIMN